MTGTDHHCCQGAPTDSMDRCRVGLSQLFLFAPAQALVGYVQICVALVVPNHELVFAHLCASFPPCAGNVCHSLHCLEMESDFRLDRPRGDEMGS
jgi:hypothetical protein